MRVKCVKCNRTGNLTIKKTKTRDTYYEYYYVQHYIKETGKIEWCYIGSYDKLPDKYKEMLKKDAVHNSTQHYTQNDQNLNNEELSFKSGNSEESLKPRWPSRLGHRLGKAEVAGSNPARGSKPQL